MTLELWLLTLLCGAATYLFRGLGVALSGRISTGGRLFEWVSCVAYAMLAGLIARIIVMPTGLIAQTALAARLSACAVALTVYFLWKRNLLAGLIAGTGALIAINYAGLFPA